MIEYKIRDITYSCNEETGECLIAHNGEEYRTQNFIEGFNYFWQISGSLILQGIKTSLTPEVSIAGQEKRMGKQADRTDSIFISGNKYGYKVNVNHPQIQPLYERFKEKLKTPILSDRQRFQFENIIISMFSKNHDKVQREEKTNV